MGPFKEIRFINGALILCEHRHCLCVSMFISGEGGGRALTPERLLSHKVRHRLVRDTAIF